jgi:hypothetical protein
MLPDIPHRFAWCQNLFDLWFCFFGVGYSAPTGSNPNLILSISLVSSPSCSTLWMAIPWKPIVVVLTINNQLEKPGNTNFDLCACGPFFLTLRTLFLSQHDFWNLCHLLFCLIRTTCDNHSINLKSSRVECTIVATADAAVAVVMMNNDNQHLP